MKIQREREKIEYENKSDNENGYGKKQNRNQRNYDKKISINSMITIHHSLLLPTVQSLPSYLSLEVLFFDNQRLSHCFFGIQDTCSYIWKERNEI